MLYAKKDKGLQSFFIQSSKAPSNIINSRWRGLDNLVAYAEAAECRHAEILTYYQDSQRLEKCGHCDVCTPKSTRRVRTPILERVTSALGLKGPKAKSRRKGQSGPSELLTPDQTQLFENLRKWRREKARELDVPAFVVLSDKTLRHLAQTRPKQMTELKSIYGLGDVKIENFGSEFLADILLFT